MQKRNNSTLKLYIRTGDLVKVLSGNYKSKQGKVLKLFPKSYRAIVEGVNIISQHKKPSTKNPHGGINKKEAPVHISNLMLVDPATGDPTRVGKMRNNAGKLERYSKKTGKIIKNG